MSDLLFLSHRLPYPPNKGEKIRAWHMLQRLAPTHRIHLGCFYDDPDDAAHIAALAPLCASLCCLPLHPRRARAKSLRALATGAPLSTAYFSDARLTDWIGETMRRHRPRQAFVFCSAMAPYALRHSFTTRILDMVDVDSEKWRQYAAASRWPISLLYAREARALLALERRAVAAYDATLLVSTAEAEMFLRRAPEATGRLRVIENGVDDAYFRPDGVYPNPYPDGSKIIVFTGAMDYRPNVEAVDWFAREVMPLLGNGNPPPDFWIVGANPTAAVRRLGDRPGISVTGRVADIRPYLAHAAAVVAPLQMARGIQNKVLEGMAMAKPVVATPAALEGLVVRDGADILSAATPQAFVEQLAAAFGATGTAIGLRARARIEANYRWAAKLEPFDRLFDEFGPDTEAGRAAMLRSVAALGAVTSSLPRSGDLPDGVAATWRQWLMPVLCLGGAVVALGLLFPGEIIGAYRVWIGSTAFSHCFLVLPLALYLVWDRRDTLAGVAPQPAWWALPMLPVLSIAWLFAAVLGVLELQQFILLSMVECLLLTVLGWRIFLLLFGPCLYLFLLIPTGEFLVPGLQDFTARFVVASLRLVGVPVFSDGILIQIPQGDFMVAEACAGLRFLIASVAFGIFFALIVYRRWTRRLCFVAISLVVPIIANGLRAFGIVYLAHVTDDVVAVEADHVIYGWGFFAAVMLLLIAIGLRFADQGTRPVRPARTPPSRAAAPGVLLLATGLVLAGAALGLAYAAFLDAPGLRPDLSTAVAPAVAPPWRPASIAGESWRPILVAPDREFRDAWTDGGKEVQRFLALYAVAGRDNNLVRSQNRIADEDHWARTADGRASAVIDGKPVQLNATIISAGSRRRLVWYAYIVDGHVTASALDAKLRQAGAILVGGSTSSAFLALATDATTDPDEAAATLGAFTAAMAPMGDYLRHVADHRP